MTHSMLEKLETVDWMAVVRDLHEKGYARVHHLLSVDECAVLRNNYEKTEGYRKTIVMERYRFGSGEYKYFDYPLPVLLHSLRVYLYNKLAPVANQWMNMPGLEERFPDAHEELLRQCMQHDQHKATVLILKYGKGGYNTLHQDLYGDVYFPLQAVLFLSQPDTDYTGGEFVLTQQNPRAQSKAIVLKPDRGDVLIFTTNFRPVRGTKGYYRVTMKHGVSELLSGERYTLGIIFHDAKS